MLLVESQRIIRVSGSEKGGGCEGGWMDVGVADESHSAYSHPKDHHTRKDTSSNDRHEACSKSDAGLGQYNKGRSVMSAAGGRAELKAAAAGRQHRQGVRVVNSL